MVFSLEIDRFGEKLVDVTLELPRLCVGSLAPGNVPPKLEFVERFEDGIPVVAGFLGDQRNAGKAGAILLNMQRQADKDGQERAFQLIELLFSEGNRELDISGLLSLLSARIREIEILAPVNGDRWIRGCQTVESVF